MIPARLLPITFTAAFAGVAGTHPGGLAVHPQQAPSDSFAVTYEVSGVKVIHHQRGSSDVVAANLYLLGGVRQLSAANAGLESFLLSASRYGTRAYPGDAAQRATARTGSIILVSAERDWTRFGFHGLAADFDSTWAVFSDRLMFPTLDSAAIALTRARFLAEIKGRAESPDGQGGVLAEELAYRNHAYAIDPNGSEASVVGITAASLREYLANQMLTSRMLLVVVGNVPRATVEAAVTRSIGTLPRGDYVWSLPPALSPAAPGIAAAQRTLPTNYIRGYFAGPQRSSPDFPAFEFAMQALSGWIGSAVRGTGALSYAAGAGVVSQGATGGQIYVSTTRPDTVLKLINGAIDTLGKIVAFPRWVLTDVANSYANVYARMQESSAQYADLLARSQLYNGDHRAAARYRDVLRKVVPVDLRNAISRYVKNIQWAYVGDTSRLPRELMLRRSP